MNGLQILGTGRALPKHVVTNDDLAKICLLYTSNEKRVILVIEDERTISNFICRALNANDYKSIPAFSGKEGLSLFFSHGPDLILLDLGLPDMDGMEILSQVSGLPQETPVIIISARDRESEKVKALDMGADRCV